MSADAAGVLFDIDGTLVDTNYLHTVAWFRAFDELGYRVPMAWIHHRIGMGSDKLMPDLIAKVDDDASARHGDHYHAVLDQLRALPGAGELLREVKRRGARVVLATSAEEDDLGPLLAAIGADDAIDHVTSSGDVGSSKPSPDIFQVAMDAAGLDPVRTLVVGDTVWDVEAAKRCGLRCVCVCTGGIPRETLEAAGAAAVYEDAAELLARLDDSPIARLLD